MIKHPGPERLWIAPVVDPGFPRGKGLGFYTSKLKVPKKNDHPIFNIEKGLKLCFAG